MQMIFNGIFLALNVFLCYLSGTAVVGLTSWAFNSPTFLVENNQTLSLMLAAIVAYFMFSNGRVIHNVKEQEIWMFWDPIFGRLLRRGYSQFFPARAGIFVTPPWWVLATTIPLVKGDEDVDKKVIPLETNQGDSVGVERTISYRPDPNQPNTYVQNGNSEKERQKNILDRLATVVDRIIGQIVTGMPTENPNGDDGILQRGGRQILCDMVFQTTNLPPQSGHTPDPEFVRLVRELGIVDVEVLLGDIEQSPETKKTRQVRFKHTIMASAPAKFPGVDPTRACEMTLAMLGDGEYKSGRQELDIKGAPPGFVFVQDTGGGGVGVGGVAAGKAAAKGKGKP